MISVMQQGQNACKLGPNIRTSMAEVAEHHGGRNCVLVVDCCGKSAAAAALSKTWSRLCVFTWHDSCLSLHVIADVRGTAQANRLATPFVVVLSP